MATRNYSVGPSGGPITVQVVVSTAASCASEIYTVNGANRTKLTQSSELSNGSIPGTGAGTAVSLAGSSMSVQTLADITALPDDVKAAAKADINVMKTTLAITYTISGGADGTQVFTWDNDDYFYGSDSDTYVTKQINFIN